MHLPWISLVRRHLPMAVVLVLFCSASAQGQAVKVELVQQGDGWKLLRGGEPYYIKGAGGDAARSLLADSGGNSFRTWGVGDDTLAQLDEAHRLGLSVSLGIWLEHERHGFDYSDEARVAAQFEKARQAVLKYKDHPAVLAWGVGNEVDGYEQQSDPKIWAAIQQIAKMIHETDPNHPTMVVVAELGGDRIAKIHALCPDIDIIGVNSYGGVVSLPQRYAATGATKPYVVTEFGPPGIWEIGRNAWGIPEELTSTQKGEIYRKAYKALEADDDKCLGSYVFLWGNKQEATATWFGMFLPDGSKLAAVDAMTECWSGRPPENLCPRIEGLRIEGTDQVPPGGRVTARLGARDPEGEDLQVEWTLVSEVPTYSTGGDGEAPPPEFAEAFVTTSAAGATLRMPEKPGSYRLFAIVKDPQGAAATANVPIRVTE